MTAEVAIRHFRRDLTLAAVLRVVFIVLAGVSLLWAGAVGAGDRMLLLGLIGGVWIWLNWRSARGTQLVAASPALIAAGAFDEAERQIDQALRSFSMFRTVKILGLHHLAVLRHAQQRWSESALLCRALLDQRLGALQAISRPSRLMLAESLLEMSAEPAAYEVIARLGEQKLALGEQVQLNSVQIDYALRTAAWGWMLDNVMGKVELAELLPPPRSARAQASLGLAARKLGRRELADWLRQRVELLIGPVELSRQRPALWELFAKDDAPAPELTPQSGSTPAPGAAPAEQGEDSGR